MNELVRCLESGDPAVRSRAADALEKLTAKRPDLLKPLVEASCGAGAPALRARGRKSLSLLKEEPDGL